MPTFSVRTLDANGDMLFGDSLGNFLSDSPSAVGQCIQTRLLLFQGEWFLNLQDGTPWFQQIIGKFPQPLSDAAIRRVILETPYVLSLSNYASHVDPRTRALTVSCDVQTAFGQTTVYVPFTATADQGPFAISQSPIGGFQGTG